MRLRITAASVGLVIALAAGSARAISSNIVYSQLPHTGPFSESFGSDLNNVTPGQQGQKAEDVIFAQETTITGVRWWGGYLLNDIQVDNFVIRFYTDNGGVPADAPFVVATSSDIVRSPTAFGDGFPDIYQYEGNLDAPVVLGAATPFYVSVLNATAEGNWRWFISDDGVPDSSFFRVSDGDPWFDNDQSSDNPMALELAAVPEPLNATLCLAGLGALGLVIGRRRGV